MTQKRSSRAFDLFEEALHIEERLRKDFLERACAGDRPLFERVVAMLAADGKPHDVLDRPRESLAEALAPQHQALEGRRVGPYSIIREIGRGGMGVVYLAERRDVNMRVALKLISSSLASEDRVARFHYERRVLALLEHRYIARFLDAGVAEDETPWFAMEYVDGDPIDEYCDRNRLTIDDRLALFDKVGEAVAHAHRNLLVHRDLKPSNVLVTDDGSPKLVDFGIAKRLRRESDEHGTVTQGDRPPMTPDYASPEQIAGAAVTTASDVFQMGLLLYELLTGRKPKRRADGLPSVGQTAPHSQSRPSSIVTKRVEDNPTPEQISALRQTTPPRLASLLRGDLDNIVQMAMRHEPERRYQSAQEMVEDVRRHRTGLPVIARPGSITYHVGKFISRHKAGSAMAAVFALFLSVATVAFSLQARRVSVERDRAEQMALMFERLVTYADPTAVQRDSLAPRAVVDDAARTARAGMQRDPEIWAQMLVAVGRVYRNLGLHDSAITIWTEVVDALEPVVSPRDPNLIEAFVELGTAKIDAGEFDAGHQWLGRALAYTRALGPDRRTELATALIGMGFGRQVAGDDARAEELYDEGRQILESLPDSGGRPYETVLINLGYIADRRFEYKMAEANFRLAVDRRVRSLGPTHPRTLNAKTSLARTLLHQGVVDEASTLSAEALAVRRERFPEPHRNLAESLELQASVLAEQREFPEAERLAREALEMYRTTSGDDHINVAFTMSTLGLIIADQERFTEAHSVLREALRRYRKVAGENHPATLSARANLARNEHRMGQLDAARRDFEMALTGLDSLMQDRSGLAAPLTNYGELLIDLNQCNEATPILQRAIALARKQWPEDHENVTKPRTHLAKCSPS